MVFVDAHHHLWDLGHCDYPWLMARGQRRFFGDPTPIQKNYLVTDLRAESLTWTPDKSVHVQVGVAEAHALRESQWLQSVGAEPGSGGLPNAIVAFVDLTSPAVGQALDEQRAIERVRGVRHIVGRHAEEDARSGAADVLASPAFEQGLRALAARGLSFDLQLIETQWADAAALLARIPDLRVTLCHLASPWDQGPEGFGRWRRAMRAFAALPQVHCKISGFGMFRPDWTAEDLRPWALELVALFGPRRVMLGSNFPVDRLYGSYDRIWSAYDEIFAAHTPEERNALFRTTAETFYRI